MNKQNNSSYRYSRRKKKYTRDKFRYQLDMVDIQARENIKVLVKNISEYLFRKYLVKE